MKSRCYRCVIMEHHPWHDNGTPNMAEIQCLIDGYTNYSYPVRENNDDS